VSDISAFDSLVSAFCCLPGVGAKSAQRMALHLIEKDRQGASVLSEALQNALEKIGKCKLCRNLSEGEYCEICMDPRRDKSLICVVENPADVFAIEQSGTYKGLYFVLMGYLSPLDGIGPNEIGLEDFKNRIIEEEIKEVILATNPTVEGEATAFYITKLVGLQGIQISRIAHGVPIGGELEYVDSNTLAHALSGRRLITK
tara:strand:- start:530 stop:1132 length:603 start_codon:yes stop_codon:yes gene_type:complete